MDALPRCETNDSLIRSSLVVQAKLLQWSFHAIPDVGLLEVSCNKNQTLVTGSILHYEDHPHFCFHMKESSTKTSLQYPDCSIDTTRFKLVKYWNGLIPPQELVEAGFDMIARNLVKCFSCNVLVHVLDWKRGDDSADINFLHSPNCDLLRELLNRVCLINKTSRSASRDGAGIRNYHSCSEKPLITYRVKKEGSLVNSSLSVTSKTKHPSLSKPLPVTTINNNQIIPGMDHPLSQQSVSILVNLPKSTTKSTDAITCTSPREQIILVR